MSSPAVHHSPKRLARTAGLLYLAVAICGGFAHAVRLQVYVPGDAATTVGNVVANAELVRLSFVAELVDATFFLFTVMALYILLQHVNKSVARAMVIFVVVAAGIKALNMVHQLAALLVATAPSYTDAFGTEGSNALVLLLLDLQHNGSLVAQIFFGLWLFPLGLLAYRSGMFPRPLCWAPRSVRTSASRWLRRSGIVEGPARCVGRGLRGRADDLACIVSS